MEIPAFTRYKYSRTIIRETLASSIFPVQEYYTWWYGVVRPSDISYAIKENAKALI
jgi:hypothetical protein